MQSRVSSTWARTTVDNRLLEQETVPAPIVDDEPEEAVDLGAHDSHRYDMTSLLGEGGMGEVRLCVDQRIRRAVAMKVMRSELSKKPAHRERFLREALAQAQLEHPAIVPVYDVGLDSHGDLYFTMRRVNGSTLERFVRDLRKGQTVYDSAERVVTQHRLLSAFASACLAVHYAHTLGVFHCDLKPANIMLGSFGEVYVLDWGLATIASGDGTKGGGTLGYMAPEQLREEEVDARADVWALGVTLFELLTLRPLYMGSTAEIWARTLGGKVDRPSVRAPERNIAPELDAIVMRATALHPRDRYATVRDLHDDLERYMSGDRDLALRRDMSRRHATEAALAVERSRSGGPEANAFRSDAMRDVGRALALDPTNQDALKTMIGLLSEPPEEVPPEARAEMAAANRSLQRTRARAAAIGYISYLALLPIFLVTGLASPLAVSINAAAWLVPTLIMLRLTKHPTPDGHTPVYLAILSTLAIVASALIGGPGVAACLAPINVFGFTLSMKPCMRLVPAASIAAGLIVLGILGRLGIGWPEFPPVLFMTALVCVATGAFFGTRIYDRLATLHRREMLQGWQVRQLLPHAAAASSRPRLESVAQHKCAVPVIMEAAESNERWSEPQ